MMYHAQGSSSRNHCTLLAVLCGNTFEDNKQKQLVDDEPRYPFPDLTSAGRLEVQVLNNPSDKEFQQALETCEPSIVYFRGEQDGDSEEIGPLTLGDTDFSSPDALCGLFGSKLPTTVYLEVPHGEDLAEALNSEGVPYVIYWKSTFSRYAACHFRQALLSVIQSSCSHTWDAFHLANASFRLYCVRNKAVLPSNSHELNSKTGPYMLGDPPKMDLILPEADAQGDDDEEEDESSPENIPSIKIYDEDVNMRFLVCGLPLTPDAFLLESLEDGLNALLSIEMRGSKLHNRTSAPPPPLQAGTFSRGVVTMRCDISTCTSAHVSLLVSGSAQTCFNDQILENHIKHDIVENCHLVHSVPSYDESRTASYEPRKSMSIACGASVFEVSMTVPLWASQVLRQLAPDVTYRSLVMLGIASVQGLSVASFEKDDAERLLFFCTRHLRENSNDDYSVNVAPNWLLPPPPTRKRSEPCEETKALNIAALRPLPRSRRYKTIPFAGFTEGERYDGEQGKANLSVVPAKHSILGPPAAHRKALSSSYQAHQLISLNPLPLKKHGCGRAPIQACSEEEFLRDVMQFLILRGHTRLVPQGGLAEFPDAILNAKRLDLFNLYREVVSRGGFHVGNGINWKGQVFSKMRNHTLTNRMTGVGNTLKRHYETYLLEYELAHDDVDGECCLLCHSSAAGDWVNCGICGEWAHFGCDRRPGLGAFKDYAKTDGLEYICPHCSVSNFKKKSQKAGNGY